MGLNLDLRQRGMLLEMGVHVWLPQVPIAKLPHFAAQAESTDTSNSWELDPSTSLVSQLPPASRPMPPRETAPLTPAKSPSSTPAAWWLGEAQALYIQASPNTEIPSNPRWLVLAETPPTALPNGVLADFSAFDGKIGQLLDNMLRAAQRHQRGLTWLAPLVRQGTGVGLVTPEFSAALADLIAQIRPDIVLIMGRFASQSLLPGLHFGQLRGHVHTLHGVRAIVTYHAPYLLRTPSDKAKAWVDLCLAVNLTIAP